MSGVLRIWLEISHHGPFQVGGWGVVRAGGGETSGVAGGERRIGPERAALLGLIAALKPPRAGRTVQLHASSDVVLSAPARLAAAEAGEPLQADLDLWAQLPALLQGVSLVRAARQPQSPSAFAAAWAELARDRAKDRGPFSAPIPRSNLAKAGVPAA